jgi:hypothetical protein
MGAVDTTYTFTATDTITSAKMNNIIDQTTITADAIIGTTLDVASGKLKIRSAGITSNEMGANSVVTAAITDSNVTTAKIADANVTQAKLASNVAGNGPAFYAYLGSNQACPNDNARRVIQLNSEDFDTNSCFNNSTYRFLPNVAGYYQINLTVDIDDQNVGDFGDIYLSIRLNAARYYDTSIIRIGSNSAEFAMSGSALIYMNGTTDYIDATVLHAFGTASSAILRLNRTYMSGFLARSV